GIAAGQRRMRERAVIFVRHVDDREVRAGTHEPGVRWIVVERAPRGLDRLLESAAGRAERDDLGHRICERAGVVHRARTVGVREIADERFGYADPVRAAQARSLTFARTGAGARADVRAWLAIERVS